MCRVTPVPRSCRHMQEASGVTKGLCLQACKHPQIQLGVRHAAEGRTDNLRIRHATANSRLALACLKAQRVQEPTHSKLGCAVSGDARRTCNTADPAWRAATALQHLLYCTAHAVLQAARQSSLTHWHVPCGYPVVSSTATLSASGLTLWKHAGDPLVVLHTMDCWSHA